MSLSELAMAAVAFVTGGGALALYQRFRGLSPKTDAVVDFATAELPAVKAEYERLQKRLAELKARLEA